MFNHDAQGDFNVSRAGLTGAIKVFNADMEITATFSGDNAEELYGYMTHGIATHGSYTVFNLDTGEFIVGDLGQLAVLDAIRTAD